MRIKDFETPLYCALTVALVLVLGAWLAGTWAKAAPGYEVVLVDRPFFFGNSGVREETIKEGQQWIFSTTLQYPVRVQPQSLDVKIVDFSTADKYLLDFSSSIQYQITDPKALIRYFGLDWFKAGVERQYSGIVRDAVKRREMEKIMTDANTANEMDDEITTQFEALIKARKLPIKIIGITLGRATPDDAVLKQVNATAAQKERERTLKAATAAEQQRFNEQEARALADNAYRNKLQLTTEQYLGLKQIEAYSTACASAKATCIITSGQQPIVIGK